MHQAPSRLQHGFCTITHSATLLLGSSPCKPAHRPGLQPQQARKRAPTSCQGRAHVHGSLFCHTRPCMKLACVKDQHPRSATATSSITNNPVDLGTPLACIRWSKADSNCSPAHSLLHAAGWQTTSHPCWPFNTRKSQFMPPHHHGYKNGWKEQIWGWLLQRRKKSKKEKLIFLAKKRNCLELK